MNTKLIVVTVVAVIVFLLVAYVATNNPEQSIYPELTKLQAEEASGSGKLADHRLGTGKHILIEYSDLQCPACKSFHDFLKSEKGKDPAFAKLMDEQYTFVYRHFPLTNIHANAELAARSAESAALQGRFYEFVDRVFATQSDWAASKDARKYFVAVAAKDLGLDGEKFDRDIDSEVVSAKIESDVRSGEAVKVDATPTFFIDGTKIKGFGTFEEFKKIIIDMAKS